MKLVVRLTRHALADRDRLFEFLAETNLAAAERALLVLSQAFEDIAAFPEVGRAGPKGFRKLIVRFGQAGYEIRYRLYPERAIITRIFHTREDR